MSDFLGSAFVWALYLGACLVVARGAIPFIISALALSIVFWVILKWTSNTPRHP